MEKEEIIRKQKQSADSQPPAKENFEASTPDKNRSEEQQ